MQTVTSGVTLAPSSQPWRVHYVKNKIYTSRSADLGDRAALWLSGLCGLTTTYNHIDQTSIEPPPPFIKPVQAALSERRYHSFDAYLNVPAEHRAEHSKSNLYHLVMPTIDFGLERNTA